MMHPVEEVRIRSSHPNPVQGSCYIGLAGDDLVRIRSVNGHVFHVRWTDLMDAIEKMRAEVRRTAIKPPTPTAEWLPGGANYDAMAQKDRFDEDDAKGVSDDEA